MLILVRHAEPLVNPDVDPHQWRLAPAGHLAAAALARRLPAGSYLTASAEPKAYQTLAAAGPAVQDARFGEIEREGEPFDDNFRELRTAYVNGTDHPGWESRTAAVRRFDAAVSSHLHLAGHRPLVIASHGMVMTLWLTERVGLADPVVHWSSLRLPDAHVVDLAARTISRLP